MNLRLFLVGMLVLAGMLSCRSNASRESRAGTPSAPEAAVFSADSAWSYLEAQTAFGPRVPGTAGHKAAAAWLEQTLRRHGAAVFTQRFSYTDPDGTEWPLVNIGGTFGSGGANPLLLVAHWDSRPWADQDPEPRNRTRPILGANDGASGVAVLLEVARHLKDVSLPRPVHVLFVDGEDLGTGSQPDTYCQGSRYFARHLPATYHAALVLDMVGDRDLLIPIEYYSVSQAPSVVDWVWRRGEALAPEVFSRKVQGGIVDDHLPLQEAGIPAVDLIDFDYWAWHTLQDDLPQVSAASLERVGSVILSLVLDP